ncbi:hypothetical protein [Mesorhizobium sp. CN2-181]|uniref:hypothetical protein n=1 Tax=Mesorhizobium yinganensis TaxID=3157707 RepID=UPI0032B75153
MQPDFNGYGDAAPVKRVFPVDTLEHLDSSDRAEADLEFLGGTDASIGPRIHGQPVHRLPHRWFLEALHKLVALMPGEPTLDGRRHAELDMTGAAYACEPAEPKRSVKGVRAFADVGDANSHVAGVDDIGKCAEIVLHQPARLDIVERVQPVPAVQQAPHI